MNYFFPAKCLFDEQLLREHFCFAAKFVDDVMGGLHGVGEEEIDLALRVVAQGLPLDTAVSMVMTPDPTTAPGSAGIETVLRLLRKAGTRRLPLVNPDGTLAAIVTHDDLVPLLARELQNVGDAIERGVDASDLR